MQIHQISRPDWLKKIKRIGRGGKRGTYSGKGNKGQKSRSGGNIPPGFEGQDTTLVARSPKIKGFTSPNRPNVTLGLSLLEKHFKAGEVVSPVSLTKKKLIKLNNKSRFLVAKALTIENCLISKGAKAAIEKAGGKVFNSEKNKEQRTEGK